MTYAKKVTIALAAAAALGAGTALLAQDQSAAPPPPPAQQGPPMGGPHGGGPGDMHRMAKELNLTPDQRQQVKTIKESERTQMEAIHSNGSLTQAQAHQQMKALHESSNGQIRNLLNDQQKQKFDAMLAEQHQRHEERMQHEGGAPPPPPPPAQ